MLQIFLQNGQRAPVYDLLLRSPRVFTAEVTSSAIFLFAPDEGKACPRAAFAQKSALSGV